MQIEVEDNMNNRLESERLVENATHSNHSNQGLRHYLESMSSFFDNNNKLRFYQSLNKDEVTKFSSATILGHKYFNGNKESIPEFATDFSKLIQEKNLDNMKEKAINNIKEQKIMLEVLSDEAKEDIRRKADLTDENDRLPFDFMFGEKSIEEYEEWYLSKLKGAGLPHLIDVFQTEFNEHYNREELNGLPTEGLYIYIHFHDGDGLLNEFYDEITCQAMKLKIDQHNSLPIEIRKVSQFTIILFINEFDIEFIFESEDGNVFDTRHFTDHGAE